MLADDPIFGRFCFGGDWRTTSQGIEIIPKDGLRRRFHARLGDGKLDLILDNDRFAAGAPILLKENFSLIRLQIESSNPQKHFARLHLSGLPEGNYHFGSGDTGSALPFAIKSGKEAILDLPLALSAATGPATFTIARQP